MIRISRIIAKERIADLLDLNFVSKIELRQGKQGFNNPAICRVEIYLLLENDKEYFNSKMACHGHKRTNITLLLLLLVWLSKTDLLKNLLLMTLTIQFLKSIKHYVIFIQQVTLIYLIEENYERIK